MKAKLNVTHLIIKKKKNIILHMRELQEQVNAKDITDI